MANWSEHEAGDAIDAGSLVAVGIDGKVRSIAGPPVGAADAMRLIREHITERMREYEGVGLIRATGGSVVPRDSIYVRWPNAIEVMRDIDESGEEVFEFESLMIALDGERAAGRSLLR